MKYDIAVIGGGPAGVLAAGRAAELGAKVVLIEKNQWLGSKLLITGKGRCNITQAEFDLRTLVGAYGSTGKFLFAALANFGVQDIIDFFEKRGVQLKYERGGRVFPVSDEARDVLKALENYLKECKVEVKRGEKVNKILDEGDKIYRIVTSKGEIEAKQYIIATGGKSYPGTGSTGDGMNWANKLGHNIVKPRPALVPLVTKESWVKDMQGLSLKNVEISIWSDKKKIDSRFGEMLFTHFGISGPIILDISRLVGEYLNKGDVRATIDLKPALDEEKLDERIQRDFSEVKNKLFRNALGELLPQKLIPLIIKLSGIPPEKQVNAIKRDERKKLVHLLKNLEVTITDTMGFDFAIVTAGGVDIKEIDPRTMQSKKFTNLYFAGEVLDVDGPTGGYNLQVAWSTGYLAGESAAKNVV